MGALSQRGGRQCGCHGTLASPGSGRDKPGLGALADDVALEFSKGAEVENELPAAGRGVDLLGQALEANTLAVELRDHLDEVLEGTAEAVQAPHYQGVPAGFMHEGLRSYAEGQFPSYGGNWVTTED